MGRYAYFQGEIVPLADANISIMTHAFNYGTACFEGIRGNYNAEEEQLYLFRMREHFQRLEKSCRILKMKLPHSVEELCEITRRLVEKNGKREDVYVRPIAYKGASIVGVRLHDVDDHFCIFTVPFGAYLDVESGAKCGTSSWRRVDDLGIPARAKITGIYVNSALAKTEAHENGYDEAIMLTHDGHVSEGSGENVFVVHDGALITPPPSDNILVGITRDSIVRLARNELDIPTSERPIDRSELYIADEVFMTGTAAHVTPVIEVDRRPIGDGAPGPITRAILGLYFDVIRGKNKRYVDWCTPVYPARVEAKSA